MNLDQEIVSLVTELATLVTEQYPELKEELERTSLCKDPKGFFMWLQALSEKGRLNEDAERKLTELYGLLR